MLKHYPYRTTFRLFVKPVTFSNPQLNVLGSPLDVRVTSRGSHSLIGLAAPSLSLSRALTITNRNDHEIWLVRLTTANVSGVRYHIHCVVKRFDRWHPRCRGP